METKTLEFLRQLAYRAHNNTGFSPDKRAESVVNDYSEELDQDLLTIKSKGANPEQVERYKVGYIVKITAWLSSKSNCISSMITGPANFPVRRAEKANRAEENKHNDFRVWREKVLKAYDRHAAKVAIIEAGGPIEIAKRELESLKANHELMKEGNKRIKEAKRTGEDLTQYLTETFGIQPHMIDFTMSWGFGLANNNAKIKRVEQRIKELEQKEANKATGENQEVVIPGGLIVVNYELDRITIKHDTKPGPGIIKALKHHGFKWTPHYGCWMRKITRNAMFTINHYLLPILKAA